MPAFHHPCALLYAAMIGIVALPSVCNATDKAMAAVAGQAAGRADFDRPALRDVVEHAIAPLMSTHAVPGLAVAVTIDGQAMYFNFGVAVIASQVPVRETTLFEIGSVSKTFTATLGAYAEALGAFKLVDHPWQYLPELRGSPIDAATLQQLATYTAGGLPLQFPEAVNDRPAMIEYFRHWQPDAAPGASRQYSNLSIGLFGAITARALRRDFNDAMHGLLFAPLGLQQTYLQVPASAMSSYAWGYSRENQPTRVSPGMLDAQTYGIKSSSADILRFVQANIAMERLPQPLRQAVQATHLGRYQVGVMVQGLGWEQYPYPVPLAQLLAGNDEAMLFDPNPVRWIDAVRPAAQTEAILFNKTGSTNGFGAYVAFVPAAGIGVVLLANKNYPIAARVTAAHEILDELARQSAARNQPSVLR